MNYFELDPQEQELINAVENGEFAPVKNLAAVKEEAILAAKNTLSKTRNINIRISERDLYKLKAKAAYEGIPYQTLASSIIHQVTR